MSLLCRVVDNRVFLLGLDHLYREAMKHHERHELHRCAKRVAEVLRVAPKDVPIEGYYSEDEVLIEYFRIVRALQDVGEAARHSVEALPEFQRLHEVMSAPLFGCPQYKDKLLPVGRDSLSQALADKFPIWNVEILLAAAHATAIESDDISLVGLASRVKDVVVLTAVRESVVLYAEMVVGAAPRPLEPRYEWKVDEDLAGQARRFIDTFNALFSSKLPAPEPASAEHFWRAMMENVIDGRCVRLGLDDTASPVRHYHWAIYSLDEGQYAVQEFWSPRVWTTKKYRAALHGYGPCSEV